MNSERHLILEIDAQTGQCLEVGDYLMNSDGTFSFSARTSEITRLRLTKIGLPYADWRTRRGLLAQLLACIASGTIWVRAGEPLFLKALEENNARAHGAKDAAVDMADQTLT